MRGPAPDFTTHRNNIQRSGAAILGRLLATHPIIRRSAACLLPAELLEGAEGGSSDEDDDLSGSGSEEDEEEDADLADLDYDALLAAGAAHRRPRRQAGGGSDSEAEEGDEDEGQAAQQLAGAKRKRAAGRGAAARAAVEDEHFKLGEQAAPFCIRIQSSSSLHLGSATCQPLVAALVSRRL